jgi:quercetin dioxygenase-like cupin family protein
MKAYQLKTAVIFFTIFTAAGAIAQDKIIRKEILTANVGTRIIRKVDVREIDFHPGQKTGYHKHPCPVVSYIVSGTVLFQVEGDTLKTFKAGDVLFEPANTPIVHYDNASQTEPLKFMVYYLINKEKVLIEMLPPKSKV